MQTIVIMIIILIVIVAVIMFVMSAMNTDKDQTGEQANFAKCQAICSKITAFAESRGDVVRMADDNDFCELGCDKYISCNPNDLCSAGSITCSGSSSSC